MSDTPRGAEFIVGFLVGALAGGAAALLFAPQSGEETRTLIHDKGIELKDQAGTMTAEARKRAEQLQAQAKDKAIALQTQVKDAVQEGKTAASRKKEDLLVQVEVQPADVALVE